MEVEGQHRKSMETSRRNKVTKEDDRSDVTKAHSTHAQRCPHRTHLAQLMYTYMW